MHGIRYYRYVDNSAGVDHRNISYGRPRVVGTCVHTTSGVSSLNWLITGSAQSGKPASADYLIDRDGTQHKLCPAGYYPYHAGESRLRYDNVLYQGDAISSLLLGIELENTDNDNCSFEQVDSLAAIIVQEGLQRGWRWPYYVVGHYEIARPLGRRSDPQGFPWGDFMGRLYVRALAVNVAGL